MELLEEPVPGKPEDPWEREQRINRNMSLFRAWTNFDSRERSQIVTDLWYGNEKGPRWEVSVPNDPAQPVLCVPAGAEHEAVTRYVKICGITKIETPTEIVATRWTPAD